MIRIIREYGPYDVIHSHVHHFSGYVLKIAKSVSIPVRIAHSHNDTLSLQKKGSFKRRLYRNLMKKWIDKYSTVGLAASGKAAYALFGCNWNLKPWIKIHYYGIDLDPFRGNYNLREIRSELGIDEKSFVIGHIGRFEEQKNHVFVIDIFEKVVKRDQKAVLLLVGNGSLLPNIKKKVADINLKNKVCFAGIRKDIPRILIGAIDVLILPSLFEGLPLVALEAQAAGKWLIRSEEITGEGDIVPAFVKKISHEMPAERWADAILRIKAESHSAKYSGGPEVMKESQFNILNGLKELEKYYEGK